MGSVALTWGSKVTRKKDMDFPGTPTSVGTFSVPPTTTWVTSTENPTGRYSLNQSVSHNEESKCSVNVMYQSQPLLMLPSSVFPDHLSVGHWRKPKGRKDFGRQDHFHWTHGSGGRRVLAFAPRVSIWFSGRRPEAHDVRDEKQQMHDSVGFCVSLVWLADSDRLECL